MNKKYINKYSRYLAKFDRLKLKNKQTKPSECLYTYQYRFHISLYTFFGKHQSRQHFSFIYLFNLSFESLRIDPRFGYYTRLIVLLPQFIPSETLWSVNIFEILLNSTGLFNSVCHFFPDATYTHFRFMYRRNEGISQN